MKKQKVFIKIEIDDRHVGIYNKYFTSAGWAVFGTVYLEQSTCLWKCSANDGSSCYVTHVLQEIELPSEKEILEVMDNLEENDNNSANDEWLAGANFILNKLKV